MQDAYAGVFLGLGLAYLEWSLSPFWRWGGAWAGGRWLRAALALIVALLFLITRNLWICLAIAIVCWNWPCGNSAGQRPPGEWH